MQTTDGVTHFSLINDQANYESTSITFKSYAEMLKTTEITFKSRTGGKDLVCYRVFTPGHWEDADGNWINGSWDSETRMTAIYDPTNYRCVWQEKDSDIGYGGLVVHQSGWYFSGIEFLSNDKNISFLRIVDADKTVSWRRVWTNTVPEP